MSKPSLRSSPWILGAPQSGLANDIFWMRALSSEPIGGRPGPRHLDFQVQKARNPCRCQRMTVSGRTKHKASRQPRPALRKPDPEDAGDSSELRPLGAVAQEGQLLPKREILERQMAARFQGGRPSATESE